MVPWGEISSPRGAPPQSRGACIAAERRRGERQPRSNRGAGSAEARGYSEASPVVPVAFTPGKVRTAGLQAERSSAVRSKAGSLSARRGFCTHPSLPPPRMLHRLICPRFAQGEGAAEAGDPKLVGSRAASARGPACLESYTGCFAVCGCNQSRTQVFRPKLQLHRLHCGLPLQLAEHLAPRQSAN